MDPYAVQARLYGRGKTSVNLFGALLSLALGLCLTVLSMGYAVGLHATDLDTFQGAVDEALVQTEVLSPEDADRFAQETIGYLTGRRAAWLSAITLDGQALPVPEAFTQHMAEVQRWVKAFRFMLPLMIAGVVVLVFLTLIGAAAMRTRTFSPRGYFIGAAIPILIAGVALLWALADFKSFWDLLHRLMIPGGIFAADEAVMRLFPLTMFQGYLTPIALTFAYCLIFILVLPLILMMMDRRVRKRRMMREMRQMPYYDPMEYM